MLKFFLLFFAVSSFLLGVGLLFILFKQYKQMDSLIKLLEEKTVNQTVRKGKPNNKGPKIDEKKLQQHILSRLKKF